LLILALVILLFPKMSSAQPMMCGFQGTVTAGGDSLPDGTVVTAWIDGVKTAEVSTSDSEYSLFISGDYTGKTVNFKVGKYEARQTGTWTRGETLTLDLSINSWPYQCDFYGLATIDGQHVPDGTEVSAWIDSAKVQSTTTIDSMYSLTLPGNYTGKAVSFKVNNHYTTQIVSWKRGEEIEANLTVSLGPLVCGFYGPVTLDGNNVADGTVISAWIDSAKMAQTTTIDSKYGLNIPGDYTGKTVNFKVNGQTVKESAVWVRGGNVQASLTAITTGPVGVTINLSSQEVEPGDEFTLSVKVDPNGHGISGGEIDLLSLDSGVMEILADQVKAGALMGTDPIEGIKEVTSTGNEDTLKYALARAGESPVPTSTGTFAAVGIRIKGGAQPGKYAIPNAITLTDEDFTNLDFDPPTVSITVLGNSLLGDLNGDDSVGLADLAILASAYGTSASDSDFLAKADLNSDGEIDIGDLAILAGNWGQQES